MVPNPMGTYMLLQACHPRRERTTQSIKQRTICDEVCTPVDSTPLVEGGLQNESEFEDVTAPLPPAEDLALVGCTATTEQAVTDRISHAEHTACKTLCWHLVIPAAGAQKRQDTTAATMYWNFSERSLLEKNRCSIEDQEPWRTEPPCCNCCYPARHPRMSSCPGLHGSSNGNERPSL